LSSEKDSFYVIIFILTMLIHAILFYLFTNTKQEKAMSYLHFERLTKIYLLIQENIYKNVKILL